MASRMRMTADQLTAAARAKSGVNVDHAQGAHQSRHRLAATRARALSNRACRSGKRTFSRDGHRTRRRRSATTTPCARSCSSSRRDRRRPSSRGASAKRKRCAAASRAARKASPSPAHSRTSPCATRSSAARPTFLRSCARSSRASRSARLTAPEVTKFGVEMFAICAKKESTADNSPGKRQARESIMAQRYEQRSKQYLQEVASRRDDRIQDRRKRRCRRPLALTLGEPAGIGPDITFAAWRRRARARSRALLSPRRSGLRRATRRADRARRDRSPWSSRQAAAGGLRDRAARGRYRRAGHRRAGPPGSIERTGGARGHPPRRGRRLARASPARS